MGYILQISDISEDIMAPVLRRCIKFESEALAISELFLHSVYLPSWDV